MLKDAWGSAIGLPWLGSVGWVPVGSGGGEQRIELAGAVKGMQLVAATDMGFADPDLRHGTPPAFLRHFGAAMRLQIDANLVYSAYALVDEQALGGDAVG